MAKMIKCPTCGTAIEVPAAPTGQIVKCPGCGKGLKLVAKKQGPSGHPTGSSPGSMTGQSGGSLAGASVSAMTYLGDPPPLDDLPSLDSNCVVCGRPTDPDKLVEDNGRMVCPDCIKGARSRIDRAEGGAEMLGFKEPLPAPVRRTSFINITPSFLVGTLAALILIGTQIYLTFVEKPVGTLAHGSTTKKAPATVKPPVPEEVAPIDPAATQSTETPTTAPAPGEVATPAPAPPTPDGTQVVVVPPPATSETATTQPGNESMFTDGSPQNAVDPVAPGAATPPTVPPPIVPPAPTDPRDAAVALAGAANDPLVQGIDKLQLREYDAATTHLEAARRKYVLGNLGQKLTPEQQMVLVGLAAANLGKAQAAAAAAPAGAGLNPAQARFAQSAKDQLVIVLKSGQRTRSAVLNNAIMCMSKRSSPMELADAIVMARTYLGMAQEDEYAANIFGTLVDRLSTVPSLSKVDKDKIEEHYQFLDQYNDRFATQHDGKLKWGIEWLQPDLVRQYRSNRGKPANAIAAPEQLKKDVEAAEARVYTMRQAVDKARSSGGDVVGAQNQLDAAQANFGRLQLQLNQMGAPPRPPTWLTKFDPVVPEATTGPLH